MNNLGLTINTTNADKIYQIELAGFPIINILKDNFRKYKESLKKKQIIYLEQLTYNEVSMLKNWNELSTGLKTNTVMFKGRISRWWYLIK